MCIFVRTFQLKKFFRKKINTKKKVKVKNKIFSGALDCHLSFINTLIKLVILGITSLSNLDRSLDGLNLQPRAGGAPPKHCSLFV